MTAATTDEGSSSNLVCVFCGSGDGNDPAYAEAAQALGRELVQAGYGLVYGGGDSGLMGRVARATQASGGRVVGIMPRALTTIEGCGVEIGEMVMVDSMHERKSLMNDHAAAFVALPGGFGTLEELLEITTWAQLAIHNKPVVVVNTNGYYSALKAMIDGAANAGFIKAQCQKSIVFCDTPADAVAAIKAFKPRAPRYDIEWAAKTNA
ncbi:hypothetical protein LPJ61_004865 [Coemansia biformis]|uniref:Cytokinin riboside 5'-monophosphate phosphoribohydrolase n=1 Tax=Coemansia biformis TaxID=1286918 RepID=A0A9W8CUY2_9FUNG|nr:hypothetical protein LPJ61_004865 [Coemansia biformis]